MRNLYQALALYTQALMSVGSKTTGTSRKYRFNYQQIVKNRNKPYRGMKYFADYGVWAINEKNARIKAGLETRTHKPKHIYSNRYEKRIRVSN